MRKKVYGLLKSGVAILCATIILSTSVAVKITARAQDKGTIKKDEEITVEVGDTVTLQGERAYGYSDYDIDWNVDEGSVVSIESTDDGNTYNSITKATVKAQAEGTAKVTLHADYYGFWSYDEVFTINVNAPANEEPEIQEPEPAQEPDGKELKIRLVGSFSHKMVGEEDVDGISSATGISYKPQDANAVKLEAALVDKGVEVIPDDSWHSLSYFENAEDAVKINPDHNKTKVIVTPECPGVEIGYNVWDGSIVITGKPTMAGDYKVSVQFTDTKGRTAVSNEVDFVVYERSEKLVDLLNYEHATKTADGKYIYDQVPWYIEDLGADTVVVPKDIKAWYGSHSEGTYAELGQIISLTNGEEPKQTLVIPSGCNLTMLNTRVHSGVKIVVEDGAKFTIRQSTLEGIVEVKKGGTFSVDYNDFGENAGFSTGSAINGQIRMEDGSTLANARIISHTNYSARDDANRKNDNPIVVVNGNVNVVGDVYILADEAADYRVGQKGLQVNGNLNIPEGSTVAVYGGGRSQLTSKGGDAIVLNSGTISGDGKLIAIGGFGMNMTGDRSIIGGGAAVSGKGTIATADAYLEGGYSFETTTEPLNGDITISDRTNKSLVVGKAIIGTGETTSPNYWHGTGDSNGITPKLALYAVEKNAKNPNLPAKNNPKPAVNSNANTTVKSGPATASASAPTADSKTSKSPVTINEAQVAKTALVPSEVNVGTKAIVSKTDNKAAGDKTEGDADEEASIEEAVVKTASTEVNDTVSEDKEIEEEEVPMTAVEKSGSSPVGIIAVLALAVIGGGIFGYKKFLK